MYDGFHDRIDQPSPTEVEVEYSSTYTSLQHPTTVLLFHVYHIYTQQLFNFQKIIFLLIPPHPVGLPPVFSSTFDSTSTTLLVWKRVVWVRFFATGHCDHIFVVVWYIRGRHELCQTVFDVLVPSNVDIWPLDTSPCFGVGTCDSLKTVFGGGKLSWNRFYARTRSQTLPTLWATFSAGSQHKTDRKSVV
jgi:hypothetical protein